MAEEAPRRSGRVRKQVERFADHQALEHEREFAKRTHYAVSDDEEATATRDAPVKKAKKKTPAKPTHDQAEGNEEASTKALPKKKAASNAPSWFADGAERRIAAMNRKVTPLRPGGVEKRLRPYVEEAPKSYHNSLKRAVEHDCHANHKDCPCERVQIAGSAGNVYTVTITHIPTCTCPAGIFKRKGEESLCKHSLYILHNVLKAPNHLKQQNAFLTSELKQIFANAPAMPSQIAEEDVEENSGRKSIEGDCPICFMEFEEGEDIVWCRAACGNNIHKTCFDQWARLKMGHVTCPFCRAHWDDEAPRTQTQTQKIDVTSVKMPYETGAGGYRNVRDQLDYD